MSAKVFIKANHKLICAYCENIYKSGTSFCRNCQDDKAIMEISRFISIYGEPK